MTDPHASSKEAEFFQRLRDQYSPSEKTLAKNAHYRRLKHEPIDVMRDWLTPAQFQGMCLGCALKYLGRVNASGEKGGSLNIEKAIDYLEWFLDSYANQPLVPQE